MTELIKQVLDEYGWKYAENAGTLRFEVDGESSNWACYITAEGSDSFSCYAIIPVRADKDSEESVMRLLHGINYAVRVGSFEYSQSGGQVLFKTYGILTEELIRSSTAEAKEIIRRVVAYNMLAMDFYARHIIKAACGGEVDLEDILIGGSNENERGEEI